MIPKYLEEISETVKSFNHIEKIKVRCKCGYCYFAMCVYCESNNLNIRPDYNEIMRENDKLYFVKRNFFGKIVGKFECDNIFEKKQRKIVKATCENCGKEYTLFDNYNHGYNSIITSQENFSIGDSELKKYNKLKYKSLEVYVDIYQDISYEQFKEEFENMSYDKYLNSFSNIEIYGIDSTKRKIKIFTEETA